jgi:hypothetical protein
MQYPVTGYVLEVSTVPPASPVPTDFIPRVLITVQGGTQPISLPIKNTSEFMAICALLQTPGRLIYESEQATLEKIGP